MWGQGEYDGGQEVSWGDHEEMFSCKRVGGDKEEGGRKLLKRVINCSITWKKRRAWTNKKWADGWDHGIKERGGTGRKS